MLRDCAAARDALILGGREQPNRPHDTPPVDPRVLVKARILDRQKGIFHHIRYFGDVHRGAFGLAKHGDQLAITGIHAQRNLHAHIANLCRSWQSRFNQPVDNGNGCHAQQQRAEPENQRPLEQTADQRFHRLKSVPNTKGAGVYGALPRKRAGSSVKFTISP